MTKVDPSDNLRSPSPDLRKASSDEGVLRAVLPELEELTGCRIKILSACDESGVSEDHRTGLPEIDGAPVVPVARDGRTIAYLQPQPINPAVDGTTDEATVSDALRVLRGIAGILGRTTDLHRRLQHRIAEIKALSRVSTELTGLGDLESTLDCALRILVEVMQVSAGAIRLLNPDSGELVLRASVNLSDRYFQKGPVFAGESDLDTKALAGEIIFVQDMTHEDRVRYPDLVRAEGLAAMLGTGLIFHGRAVGTVRLYTRAPRHFDEDDYRLLRVVAQQVAAAIANHRLIEEQRAARHVQRQVALASNVQKRMLPQAMPTVPGLDVAARCLPSLDLGGDLYDFLELDGNRLGLAIGDVVGKGVPAALLMASVRASLRAHALDIFDIAEIIARTNDALVADTRPEEFATIWYGVIDANSHRLAYCNAGHEPALVCRIDPDSPQGVRFYELGVGGMVIGVESGQDYECGRFTFHPGDLLVGYTDGLPDAMNFDAQRFGKQRVRQAIVDVLKVDAKARAHQVLDHILWEARRFVGFNPRSDDITVVVARLES